MIIILSILLAAPSFAAHLQQDLDSYISAYYLADSKMAEFDAELDRAVKPGLLRRSKPYRELGVLRAFLDKKTHEMKTALKAAGKSEQDTFLAKLEKLGPAERIATNALMNELRPELKTLPVFYSSLQEELTAAAAAKLLIASRMDSARHDEKLAQRLRAELSSFDTLRSGEEVRSSLIAPGTGPEGNVGGANFPANTWALTFDDGPHEKYTPQIFDNLATLGKKASFLWLVECLEKAPELAARAKALGFPANNHSWTHENLDKAKPAELQKEIVASTERATQLFGEKPRFFRLPYGAGLSNKAVRQLIAQNGMIHLFWNVDSLDWKDKDPASILARVKKAMALEKKGVILFHDIHPQSVEASKLLLRYSAALPEPHRWVTIPEIVEELNQQLPKH